MAKGTIVAEMKNVTKPGDACYEPTGVLTCRDCGRSWRPAVDGHLLPTCPHPKEKADDA